MMKRRDRSPDRPTKDRFAKLLLGGIRESGERREVIYDRGEFRLRLELARECIRMMLLATRRHENAFVLQIRNNREPPVFKVGAVFAIVGRFAASVFLSEEKDKATQWSNVDLASRLHEFVWRPWEFVVLHFSYRN